MTESLLLKAPWGKLTVIWKNGNSMCLALSERPALLEMERNEVPIPPGAKAIIHEWLEGYVRGRHRHPFPLIEELLNAAGITGFRRKAMMAVSDIGFGETRTYAQVAADIGKSGAARAVGRVMATNPYPLLVPCHRVVLSSGKPGGYRWGGEVKRRLLSWEAEMLK